MPTISTPTQAFAAEQDDEDPRRADPAALEGADPFGQRFSFEGAVDEPDRPDLDLPRVRTQVERPERDDELRNLQALVGGLGLLGATIGATGDSTTATAIGSGLARGAGQASRRAEESFQERMSAYEEFLRSTREENRARRRAEAQAQFDAALTDYELDRQQENQIAQIRERGRQRRKTDRTQAELDEPTDTEKALDRARADYYEAQAEAERRPDDQESPLPDDPDELESSLQTVKNQIRALQQRYQNVPTDTMGRPDAVRQRQIGRQIDTLIKEREAIKQKLSRMRSAEEGRQGGIPPDQRIENRETFLNQPAPSGATAPGAPADTAASGQDARTRPTDLSDQVSDALSTRIRQMAPDTVDVREALNAAALVQSDTTDYTPARFEQAFGFNPFR